MSASRLDTLQWFGLLGAPLAWATQLVVGYFAAEAHCEASSWAGGWARTEVAITVAAAIVAVFAEASAGAVYLRLRRTREDAPGPPGRQHLFAVGGLVGNILFFCAILMSGITVVSIQACRPA